MFFDLLTSFSTIITLFSSSPACAAPAIKAATDIDTSRLSLKTRGTSSSTNNCAIFSTSVLLPTPGSPTSKHPEFSTSKIRKISATSSFLPTHSSYAPALALKVISSEIEFKLGVATAV